MARHMKGQGARKTNRRWVSVGVPVALAVTASAQRATEEHGTTNLTVADRWGNVAEYTLTIESTGGPASRFPATGSC